MKLSSILHRIRWKTLSAALAPAAVGTGLALRNGGTLSLFPFLCCGPSAFLIQIGTNLVNDALDYRNGVDGPKRLGPQRLSSPSSSNLFYLAGILCFPLALIFSLPALYLRGMKLLSIEVMCCLAGYLYTGGPFPLGYHALGDLTVFVFFGVIATSAAQFVHQGGELFTVDSLVAGSQIGCTAVNLLVVNNLRDIDTDSKAGKSTISSLLGYEKGRWQLVCNLILAHILGLWWLLSGSAFACLLPYSTLPFAADLTHRIFTTKPSVHYNHLLQSFSLLHLLFSCALAMGLGLSCLVTSA